MVFSGALSRAASRRASASRSSSLSAVAGYYTLAALLWGLFIGFYESVFRAIVAAITSVAERPLAFAALHVLSGAAWAAGSIAMATLEPLTYTMYLALAETASLAIIALGSHRIRG
jgi:hypothetical protein